MIPPHCAICDKNHRNSKSKFSLLRFKVTEEQKERKQFMKANKMVGHPANKVWFCQDHIEYAKSFKHKSWPEVSAELTDYIKKEEAKSRTILGRIKNLLISWTG